MASEHNINKSNDIAMVSFDPQAVVVSTEDWDDNTERDNPSSVNYQTMPVQNNGTVSALRRNTVKSLPSRSIHRSTHSKRRRHYSQMESPLLLNDLDSSTPSSPGGSQISHLMDRMDRDPLTKQIDALRGKLQSLTNKRQVKAQLVRSESQRSRGRPISFITQAKYQLSMSIHKLKRSFNNMIHAVELWYSSLKTIEGHFGSGVATYFKFLRWLFIHNCIVLVISGLFLTAPQILYQVLNMETNQSTVKGFNHTTQSEELYGNQTFDVNSERNTTAVFNESLQSKSIVPKYLRYTLSAADLFSGEGYLTNTSLYYGFYTNDSLVLVEDVKYHIPSAYFFTFMICLLITFVSLSTSVARSYRKSFIETSDGLNNIYALKIFCSWDYGIATPEAAALCSKQIYHELKELVDEWRYRENVPSCSQRCTTLVVQISLNIIFILLLTGTAMLIWDILGSQSQYLRGRSTKENIDTTVIMSFVVSLVMVIFPMIFSYVVKFEGYRSPRTALYVTLLRTFALEVIVVGVLVSYWLNNSSECWETSLGQEVYRLVIADFFVSLLGTSLLELLRSLICRRLWPKIGQPEFDIARNTLNLIYNQTLFWVGFYFSPILALINVIKLFITFYIKKYGALYNCQSSPQSWRAAQTHTLFLALTFLSLIVVVVMYGYVITQVPASNCGPFRGYPYMYQMILEGVLNLQQGSQLFNVIMFLTRPGFVAGLLIAMGAAAYYLRAQSQGQRTMVDILRQMLIREARDKEFLLRYFDEIETFYGKGAKPRVRVKKISRNEDEVDGNGASSSENSLVEDIVVDITDDEEATGDALRERKNISFKRNGHSNSPLVKENSKPAGEPMPRTSSESSL